MRSVLARLIPALDIHMPASNIVGTGAIYLTVTAPTTTITPGTLLKVAGTTVQSECPCSNRGFDMPANNRLRWIREGQATVIFICAFSISAVNPNQNLSFQMKHFNAAGVEQHTERINASMKISSGNDVEAASILNFHTLEQNHYVEIWGTNDTSTNAFVTEHLELQALAFTPLQS